MEGATDGLIMTKTQRLMIGMLSAVVLMILADLLLVFLELPQWVRLPMMAVLGWMAGAEIRDWVDKNER